MALLFGGTVLKKLLFILLVFLPVSNLQAQVSTPVSHNQKTIPSYKKQTINYKLTEAKDHTYGYDIFLNDTLFIHQPVIPCIAGNKGFKTKTDAKKSCMPCHWKNTEANHSSLCVCYRNENAGSFLLGR